jgi:hypothetical protein
MSRAAIGWLIDASERKLARAWAARPRQLTSARSDWRSEWVVCSTAVGS